MSEAPVVQKSAPRTPAVLPEGTQLDQYRVVRRISSGGFSIVYLAQDPSGALVAIKEYMPASLAQRAQGQLAPHVPEDKLRAYRIGLKSFFEEGRTLSSINHPNIVRVLNFFAANNTVYMVMQYESGRSLQAHVLDSRGAGQPSVLSEEFIRRVFGEVMDGLREVHSNRLLHLDIKPANIYLRMNGNPILLDFGAARQTLQRDNSAHPIYTPGYAAPELYNRDAELGAWSDLYGVGATMYACMAGRPPQESPQRRQHDDMPEALRALRGAYSDHLVSLVDRCLRLNSLERPQSVALVQRELQNAPVLVKPGLFARVGEQVGKARRRVEKFVKDHDITWF